MCEIVNAINIETMAEPPYAIKGKTIPVIGRSPTKPPKLNIDCTSIQVPTPDKNIFLNSDLLVIANP